MTKRHMTKWHNDENWKMAMKNLKSKMKIEKLNVKITKWHKDINSKCQNDTIKKWPCEKITKLKTGI